MSVAPVAHSRDVHAAPTPTPLSAQAGGVGAAPPTTCRDVLPPRHPDTSDHFQNVPTTNDLRAFIAALPPEPHQGPAFLHAPHVPRGSRDPRLLPDPPAGPPHRFKVLTPGNSILYVADLREFARTHGLDHKRLSTLATAHARNPSRAPSAHKGYIPVDTQCP
ncbi:hypothetical protein [Azospirillum sp. TSH7]|uniref:hypothetical protein n=1 Tax=Azospirillum sp. TSH7 TaxID=652751 RepID=UPI001304CC19|nr:hypothetical protein [Azospirillum sp. TSH7]